MKETQMTPNGSRVFRFRPPPNMELTSEKRSQSNEQETNDETSKTGGRENSGGTNTWHVIFHRNI